MRSESHYQVYILRVWQVERDTQPVMVASLEDSCTGQRLLFANLPELAVYLEQPVHQQTEGLSLKQGSE